jgi:glucose-6-phosphate 1-dehydrogenase
MARFRTAGTSRPVASDAFVFFGATGDLAFKQIFPALAGLIRDDDWTLPIIGLAATVIWPPFASAPVRVSPLTA